MTFYKVTAEADVSKPARLDLFGEVGGGFWSMGFDESDFKNEIGAILDGQPLEIYINSQGGSVYTALAIYNLIARHTGEVTITVAGMAASAATIITSAPNAKVVMPKGSLMLIHPVRMSTGGLTPKEMQEAAENLEKVRQSVRDVYQKKTGLSAEKLDELMDAESYLTASEAVELGFADSVDNENEITNNIGDGKYVIGGMSVDASLFAHAPKGFFAAEAEKVTAKIEKSKGGQTMDLQTLMAEHPDLVQAIREEGIKAGIEQERARIKAIEEIAPTGFTKLVTEAKFENGMTAEALAVAILKAEKGRAEKMIFDRQEETKALSEVSASSESIETLPNAEEQKRIKAEEAAIIAAGARAFAKK
mgnify:CR=1 FL=1